MLRVETEECLNCGQSVLMMCQKWTGYCSAECREEALTASVSGDAA